MRASTAGLRARISLSSRPSWRASASTRSATEAPVIRLPPVSVSMPMRISWACSARRIGPAAMQQGDQLPAGELGRAPGRPRGRRRCGRGGARPGAGSADRSRPTRHAPRSRRAAGTGFSLCTTAALGLDLAGQPQVDGDVTVDADHDLAGGHLGRGGRAGQHHRFAHRLAQRGHPEVGLELGERLREGLGDRTGAVDRPARHAPDLGGDRAGLQQPQLLVGGDRPLDVLRPAEHRGDLVESSTSRRRSAGSSGGPSLASNSSDLGVRRSSTYREPSTSPLTSGSGPPRTALTTRRSVRPVTGSMPNITPPYAGSMSGWTSTAIGWSAAPARSAESSTAVTAATNASKPLMPMTDSN